MKEARIIAKKLGIESQQGFLRDFLLSIGEDNTKWLTRGILDLANPIRLSLPAGNGIDYLTLDTSFDEIIDKTTTPQAKLAALKKHASNIVTLGFVRCKDEIQKEIEGFHHPVQVDRKLDGEIFEQMKTEYDRSSSFIQQHSVQGGVFVIGEHHHFPATYVGELIFFTALKNAGVNKILIEQSPEKHSELCEEMTKFNDKDIVCPHSSAVGNLGISQRKANQLLLYKTLNYMDMQIEPIDLHEGEKDTVRSDNTRLLREIQPPIDEKLIKDQAEEAVIIRREANFVKCTSRTDEIHAVVVGNLHKKPVTERLEVSRPVAVISIYGANPDIITQPGEGCPKYVNDRLPARTDHTIYQPDWNALTPKEIQSHLSQLQSYAEEKTKQEALATASSVSEDKSEHHLPAAASANTPETKETRKRSPTSPLRHSDSEESPVPESIQHPMAANIEVAKNPPGTVALSTVPQDTINSQDLSTL